MGSTFFAERHFQPALSGPELAASVNDANARANG